MNRIHAVTQHSRSFATTYVACALSVVLSGCGAGDGQDPDPLVEDFGISFVRRPLVLDANNELTQPDIREVVSFNAGADLYYRDLASPSAPQRNITGSFTGGMGDVKDVEVSYDGATLLFAMRAPDIPGLDPADQPKWDIWEYDIEGDVLRRVIPSDITAAAGQDVAPHYLPDGRIIFSSSRQRTSRALLLDEGKPQFPALDENRNEHAMVLHVMNADGGDIHQVSFNQSHDLDPMVLSSGEVVFSRWDHMGSRDAISLYKMYPDGTGLQLLYGAHSHDTGTNASNVHFLQPRELHDGRLLSVLLPFTGTYRGGDLIALDSENYIDNTEATAENRGMLSGPAQSPLLVNDVRTDNSISPGGRFRAAWPLQDGSNRLLVSWSECRLLEDGIIMPCTAERLAGPDVLEADPLYGIFLYDRTTDTQLPVVVPEEGVTYTDVVATAPRPLPAIIFDKQPGIELDQQWADEGVGVLDIRSVYDIDGVDTAVPDIASLADPAQFTADNRPARFLRIVKAVAMPDNEVTSVPFTAFGRSSQQLMREIIGYTPVQPDGSVRVKVPANVPLAISVVDRDGRRMGARHQNWLQVRAGETLHCTGCHNHASGSPHGHPRGPQSVYAGAVATGMAFPNTEPALTAVYGETMAETLTRHDERALLPSTDLVYDDVWTDEASAGRSKDASSGLLYADLMTPTPATPACQGDWDRLCRTVINYEQHIHPLWQRNRGANTCSNCHSRTDAADMASVPDAQLDLSDGVSDEQVAHFRAYRELLFGDFAEELGADGLQDILVPGPIDPDTGLPTEVRVAVAPPMSTAGARASSRFFAPFDSGGSHEGRLDAAELRLISEWLDIGAQYYNDPFAVPVN
ncbi:MAG: hypothetical protein LJE75_08195 [Gammaproteobacteria bacterium]|nr:hypothetical protein [Gammaproteobacteria bacterium]